MRLLIQILFIAIFWVRLVVGRVKGLRDFMTACRNEIHHVGMPVAQCGQAIEGGANRWCFFIARVPKTPILIGLLLSTLVIPFPASAGQILDLNIGTATYGDLIIDVVLEEQTLDGSTRIHANVFNSGQADAVIEIYNLNRELVGLPKLVPGLRPYNSVLKILLTPVTALQSIFDDYSTLDTRNLNNSQKTEVDILVPPGGSFKLTKNSNWAVRYNIITTLLDVSGSALEKLGADRNDISKKLIISIFTETGLGELDLLVGKLLVNQLDLSDVVKFGINSMLPFLGNILDPTGISYVAGEAEAFTFGLTVQNLENAHTYDTTISYVDLNTAGGNGTPMVVRPTINSINPTSLQTKSSGVQPLTILGTGFTSSSTVNFTFDSGTGSINITALNLPRFISSTELKYDIAVGTTPGRWTVAVANGGLVSQPVAFNVVSPSDVTTAPAAPIGLNSIFGNWSKLRQFTLDWTNPASAAGISKVWWKIGAVPTSETDGNVGPINSAKPLRFSLPVFEGQQNVYVWLEDGAGNRSHLNRATIQLGMDQTPPGIVINSQLTGNTTQNTATLSGTFNDALSGVTQVTWNNNSAALGTASIIPGLSGTWTTPPITLYSGNNIIEITAIDAAGNYTISAVTIKKTDTTNSGSIMFTLSPPEAVTAGARWRANGGVWHLSGEYELNVPAGVAQVDFQGAGSYVAPQGYPVTVTAGQVTQRTESFPRTVVNVPPYSPSNPYPANGTAGLSRVNPTFSWTGGGPVGGVDYHFMLGNTSSPETNPICEFGFGAVAGNSVTCLRTLNSGTTYYWKVAARDATGAITNSPVWGFTTEYAMPDLIVSNVVLNGNVAPGANVTADVTVQNIGNFASYGTSYVHVYLSSSPGGKNVRLTPNVPNNVPVLQPGGTQTFSIPVILTGLQTGTSYLDAWIDSTQYGQVEGNINNNLRSIPLSYLDGQAPSISCAGLQNTFVKTGIANSIYYTATDDTGIRSVDFYYSVDDGANWLSIEEGVVPATPPAYGTTYRWVIPANLPIVSNLKIRVVARDASGNAGEFIAGPYVVHDGTVPTVTVVSPNGGETFGMGTTQQVRWNVSSVNPIAGTDVLFYYNGTASYLNTGNMTGSGNQTYSWTLPNNFSTVDGKLRVHVQDVNGNSAEDYSDGFFTVRDTSAPPPAPWTTPQALVSGATPQLATDSAGNLHMAYMVSSDTGVSPRVITQTIMYSKRTGATWSSPQAVYSVTQQTTDPNLTGISSIGNLQLAVSNTGLPYLVWGTGYYGGITANNQSDIYFVSFDGSNWSAPFNLSADLPGYVGVATVSTSPRIKVDSANTVHVAWTDGYYWNANSTITGQDGIYYRKKTVAGGWEPAINVSGMSAGYPDLNIDSNNTLNITFWGFPSGSSAVLHTSNNGSGWTTPVVVANGVDGLARDLASDSNNHLHMVWSYNDTSISKREIFYSYFDGVAWSPKEKISSTGNAFHPTINVDSINHPHVTWEDWGNPYKLLYSFKNGNQWTTPIQLHYDSQTVASYSSDAVLSASSNEMSVVWTDSASILYNHANVGSTTDSYPPSVSVVAPVAGAILSNGSTTAIQWSANDNVGVVNVDLHYSADNGVTWTLIAANQPNSGMYSWVVPASTSLQIRVAARDAAGNAGAGFSGTVTTSDATPPAISLTSPTSGTSLAGNSTVNVNWTATDNVAVTRVDLDYSLDGGVTWRTMASALNNSGSYAWLVPNSSTSTLLIRAVAHDAMDYTTVTSTAQPLTIVRANTPPLAPSMPFPLATGVSVSALSPILSWAGGDPDGDALTYQIRFGTTATPPVVATVSNNVFAAGTLQYATQYYWQIVASDGNTTTASPVWTFTTEASPPVASGAPTIDTATGGDAQATVNFAAPANNGGSAITSYTVTSAPGGITAIGAGSPITVIGLTNGTAYTFTVTATNAAGASAASAASNSVVPSAATTFTVSATAGANGSITPASQTVTQGNTTSFTVTPTTGYTASASGCGGSLNGNIYTTGIITANCTVSAVFARPTTSTLSFPLLLEQGWNLLGNSIDQTIFVASLFGDPNVVTTVWKWDTAQTGWQFYAPSMSAPALQTYATGKGYGVLSQINPGEGYWVNAKAGTTLATQTGAPFNLAAANLVAGWNLIGTGNDVTPSAFNTSLNATPPAFGVTTLWAWDSLSSKWYFYAPSLEAQGGTKLVDYITSKGYLDFNQHNKTLGNGVGFWVNRP